MKEMLVLGFHPGSSIPCTWMFSPTLTTSLTRIGSSKGGGSYILLWEQDSLGFLFSRSPSRHIKYKPSAGFLSNWLLCFIYSSAPRRSSATASRPPRQVTVLSVVTAVQISREATQKHRKASICRLMASLFKSVRDYSCLWSVCIYIHIYKFFHNLQFPGDMG